jgi:tripartite ATP-independent transporter DctM subunit
MALNEAQISERPLSSEGFADRINTTLESSSKYLNYLSMLALSGMMFLTAGDVIGRYLLKRPITGAFEITQYLMVILAFMAVAYTAVNKGHVSVDILTSRFSSKMQGIIGFITNLIGFGMFGLLAWRSVITALAYWKEGRADSILGVPTAPFIFVIVVGTTLLSLVLLGKCIGFLQGNAHPKGIKISGVLSGVAVLLLLACALVWASELPQIEPLLVGLLGFILLFILMFLKMPVAFCFLVVGTLGIAYLKGLDASFAILSTSSYQIAANYSFSVIPLFMLMGFITFQCGFGKDLYDVAYKIMGRLPGGLASATVAACAGFGAIVGVSTAGVITFGTIALPEMQRHNYEPGLATGCIAAGAVLCEMIPPSVTLIIWGLLTETSVGELFMASMIPGILTMVAFLLLIYIRCKINPKLGPQGPEIPFKEKITSFKNIWPTLILFLIVILGLYFGVFTPTEAGGIGAFGALVIGLIMKRLNWKKLIEALTQATQIAGMVFLIWISANLFGVFLATSKLPTDLATAMLNMNVPPVVSLLLAVLIWTALGFVMPAFAILLLLTPIMLPLFISLGFNLIWLGVIFCLVIEIAAVTPPVAIHAFILAGIAKGVPLSTIYRGSMPFVLVSFVVLILLIAFPQISLFLPGIIK